jgi:hypothetical protein
MLLDTGSITTSTSRYLGGSSSSASLKVQAEYKLYDSKSWAIVYIDRVLGVHKYHYVLAAALSLLAYSYI